MPRDADGPVFREPWEARAFAMTLRLHAGGHFTWPEWTDALSAEIKAAQGAGDADLGQSYYRHWLAALERLVIGKSLTDAVDLKLRHIVVETSRAAHHTHEARRQPVRVG